MGKERQCLKVESEAAGQAGAGLAWVMLKVWFTLLFLKASQENKKLYKLA